MIAADVVPTLVVASPDECDVHLPDRAESEVEVWAGNDGFEAYGYRAGGYLWAHLPGTAAFRFLADDPHVVAVPEADVQESVVEDAYYRNVLPLVLQSRGYEALHASAVLTAEGVLGLCGVSGSGKTTIAHALAARGLTPWADDALVLDLSGAAAAVVQVPFRLALRSDAIVHLAQRPQETAAETDTAKAPLRALAVLERAGTPAPLVDIDRLDAGAAFTALLPHAYYFRLSDPVRVGAMMDAYLRLASSIPIYAVRYRPGLDDLPAVASQLEARLLG